MDRELLPRVTCFALSLAVIFGAGCLFYGLRASEAERALRAQSEHALSVLVSETAALDAALQKTAAGSGAASTMLAADIARHAESAKTALSLLPLGDTPLIQCETWLGQAAGLGQSLLRSGVYQSETDDPAASLAALCAASSDLEQRLGVLKERLDGGDAVFTAALRGQGCTSTVADAFAEAEAAMQDFEPLRYDGLYSAHLDEQPAAGLEGLHDAAVEDARAAAATALGCPAASLGLDYTCGGTLPFYSFTDGQGVTARISRQGARLLGLTDERPVGASVLEDGDAAQRALEFLEKQGFADMEITERAHTGGTLALRCCPRQEGALLYPDEVTLSVALDDGGIVRMNADGYWRRHCARTVPESTAALPDDAGGTLTDGGTALMLTDGGRECWCREYTQELDGRTYRCRSGEDGCLTDLALRTEGVSGAFYR